MNVNAENAVLLGMGALIVVLLLIVALLWMVYFRANRHDTRIRNIETDTPKVKVRELHKIGKRNGTHG